MHCALDLALCIILRSIPLAWCLLNFVLSLQLTCRQMMEPCFHSRSSWSKSQWSRMNRKYRWAVSCSRRMSAGLRPWGVDSVGRRRSVGSVPRCAVHWQSSRDASRHCATVRAPFGTVVACYKSGNGFASNTIPCFSATSECRNSASRKCRREQLIFYFIGCSH